MAAIQWTDEFSVGIREIDEQHKKLIALINKLNDANDRGDGSDILSYVFFELVNYAFYHFFTEERLMDEYSYPLAVAHRSEHVDFTSQVVNFFEDFQSGRTDLTPDVLNFLNDWLNNHILMTDKQCGLFLSRQGAV
jgi:hemerythrin-like metal-binding protein